MTLQTLVLSQPLCAALSKKIKVESVFGWNAWSDHAPEEHSDCHELHWYVGSMDDMPNSIPAYSLGEMPAVFQALGEVMGWPHSEDCDMCDGDTVGCNCTPTWEIKWMRFCQLYATSKEDAEKYLFSLL